MAIIKDYILPCGARVQIDDSAYAAAPPEEIARRRAEINRCIDGIRWRYALRKLDDQEKNDHSGA